VWRDPDSNRGHHDFQSCALPTELSRQAVGFRPGYRGFLSRPNPTGDPETCTRPLPTLGDGDYTRPEASSKHVAEGVGDTSVEARELLAVGAESCLPLRPIEAPKT
jgi:hypothetical protein